MRLQRLMLAAAVLAACGGPIRAQNPTGSTPAPLPSPAQPPSNAVAATVNGQPIPESMVRRGLERVMPDKWKEARPELLNFLIDNMLVEQHLQQQRITVDKSEIDKRIKEMRDDAAKQKKDFDKILQELKLTEAELREHITADLRWDKYATSQVNDKALRDYFAANKETFDGTMVKARHVLLTPAPGDARSAEQAQAQLLACKAEIEAQVAAGLAKLPATADALEREKTRTKLLDEAFAAKAKEKSACPSKTQGGDVGLFQRAGFMVEPFAKVAFALKPYQMSDVVKTQFGYHLILVTERKPGRDVKFEDGNIKDDVKEVFCEKLRESVAAQVRARSTIVITPVKP